MLFSELAGKVIIDIDSGEVIGSVADADLFVDELTGRIDSLLLPPIRGLPRETGGDGVAAISWNDVVRVGDEVILISKEPLYQNGM